MKNSSSKQLKINAFLNVLKQLASIVFPLITFPYITQTLGAKHYGQIGFTASIISYISLIAGLGITNYAIREGSRLKEDKYSFDSFVNEIISLNVLAMTVSYIVLFFVILYYKNIKVYRILLAIQGISVFFTIIGCEWLNIIYEDYFFITIRYIAFQGIAVLLTFLYVKGPNDIYKYAIICQFAPVFANISNIVHFYKRWSIRFKLLLNRKILSHLKYVLVLFANAVSMLIYVNSDVTIIGIYCGDNDVGFYSVAVKIYTIVKQLLNALLLVAVPRMARWTGSKKKEEIAGQLDNLLKGLLVFLIPAIAGLFYLSKPIIILLSGSEYETAEVALKVLSITLLFSTGVCFYSNLILIPNKMEKYILKATVISAILNIFLNLVLIPRYRFTVAAYTTLFSEAFSVVYMLMVSRNKYFPSVLKTFVESLFSGLIVLVCCYKISRLELNNILSVILSIITSILCWGLYWLLIRSLEYIIDRKSVKTKIFYK